MPALEVCDLKQRAVLWTFSNWDLHGRPVLNQPIEIPVRWNDSTTLTSDQTSNTIQVVGDLVTNRDIDEASILWLGKLQDLPDTPIDLRQAIKQDTTPDIKNRNTRFEFTLMRYSDKLPQLVGT